MNNQQLKRLELTDWPLPGEILTELGRLAALWAALEAQLDMYLGKLAGFNDLTDPTPFIMVKHASFPQKLDILSALCEKLLKKHSNLKDYEAVLGKLRSAQKARNRFIHNGMSVSPDNGQIEIAVGSARGILKTKIEPVSPLDVRRASISIHEAMLGLHHLVTGKKYKPIWER